MPVVFASSSTLGTGGRVLLYYSKFILHLYCGRRPHRVNVSHRNEHIPRSIIILLITAVPPNSLPVKIRLDFWMSATNSIRGVEVTSVQYPQYLWQLWLHWVQTMFSRTETMHPRWTLSRFWRHRVWTRRGFPRMCNAISFLVKPEGRNWLERPWWYVPYVKSMFRDPYKQTQRHCNRECPVIKTDFR